MRPRGALDAIWSGCGGLRDVTVLLTADHGQVDVSPERVDYLDELWPELPAMLSQPRPPAPRATPSCTCARSTSRRCWLSSPRGWATGAEVAPGRGAV